MSEDSQDSSNRISTDPSENNSDMPEVGVGLILLGGVCLILGIAIGLVFTVK